MAERQSPPQITDSAGGGWGGYTESPAYCFSEFCQTLILRERDEQVFTNTVKSSLMTLCHGIAMYLFLETHNARREVSAVWQ